MTTFSVDQAAQESLYSFLLRSGSLLREIARPSQVPSVMLRSAVDGSSAPFPLIRSHIFSGVLQNVTLVKRKYFVTEDNAFLAEGLTHSDYFVTWPDYDASGLGAGARLVQTSSPISLDAADVTSIDSECIFIGGDTIVEPNFAHWFFEHLLKFEILASSDVNLDLPVIVSDRLPNRFLNWAELLLGRTLNWKKLNLDSCIRFKKVYVASCPAYRRKVDAAPTIWDEGFDKLATRFLAGRIAGSTSPYRDGVFFLGRSSARWRRAANELELFELARDTLNAEKIEISSLGIAEQVELARNARTLVIFAGADGPITTFCNPRCRVIEFAAPQHAAVYTSMIFCALRGVRWTRVRADRFVAEVKGPHPLDADYWVDPEKASLALTAMKSMQ
jgi:hypothetical protein